RRLGPRPGAFSSRGSTVRSAAVAILRLSAQRCAIFPFTTRRPVHLLSVFSLRNRALIALLTIVVGIFGGIALTTLKQELFPSVTLPQLTIVTTYPGASPDVVETDV